MEQRQPSEVLLGVINGVWLPASLGTVAETGVADHLDGAPKTAEELAAAVGAHPRALFRVMRLLAAHGIFALEGERFSHTAVSRFLRSDHPQSMRAVARAGGLKWAWDCLKHFDHCVRTGEPALPLVLPEGIWARFRNNPEEGRLFNEIMAARARIYVAAVLAAYDFSQFATIGDIGGGLGHLLRAILEKAPRSKGVLFDLPDVAKGAKELASDRLTVQGGDFFRDALPKCDAYLLMDVIHDWDDEHALAILSAVRRAAPRSAKILLIEGIVPEDPGPSVNKIEDLKMMTLAGGCQRTADEFAKLFAATGFRFERVIATDSDMSVVEGSCV